MYLHTYLYLICILYTSSYYKEKMVFSYIAEGAFSMENCINKQHTCFCKQLFTPIKFSLSISSGTVGSISHPSYFDKIGTLVQPFFTSKEFARFFFDLNECLWACRGRPLSPRVSSRVDCVTDNHHLPDYFVLIIIKFDDPGTWLQNRECISLLSAQLFFFFLTCSAIQVCFFFFFFSKI